MSIPLSEVRVVRSWRRSISLQVTPAGEVVVRVPRGTGTAAIERVLAERAAWLEKHMQQQRAQARQAAETALTPQDLAALSELAKQALPPLVREYAARMGVNYGKISVRCQRTLWGSCNREGNLSFNCLLLLAPKEVQTYVVVHELAHRRHMDHSPAFWSEVARVLPDYAASRRWLRENGGLLLQRAQSGRA